MKTFTLLALVLLAFLPFRPANAQERTFQPTWVKPLPTSTMAASALSDSTFVVSGWYYRNCRVDSFWLGLAPGCATDGYIARFNLNNKCLWARRVGGPGTDRLRKIIPMPGGDFIIAGDFNSTSNYGGFSLVNYGLYDGVVARMDSNGNAKWVNKLGYWAGDDFANDMAMSGDSVLVVGGSFYGACYFDSILVAGIGADHAFVAGMDPNTGRWRWARKTSNGNTDHVACVATMPDTSIVVAGTFKGTFNIGNGGFTNQGLGTDIWVAKLDKNRKWAWAKQIGGGENDYVTSVAGLPDGSVLVMGMAKRTVKFIPGTTVRTTGGDQHDIFLMKYTSKGRLLWVKQFGGKNTADWASWMKLNHDGNLSVSGFFSDTTRFSSRNILTTQDTQAGFLARMDTGGNFFSVMPIRANPGQSYAYSQVNAHAQISDSHYLVTGFFSTADGRVNIGNMNYSSASNDFLTIVKPDLTITGSQELMREVAAFQAYPNPARDRVTVQSDRPMHEPVILTDGLGREALRVEPNGATAVTLGTEHLPAGIYHLQCGKQVRKLALER